MKRILFFLGALFFGCLFMPASAQANVCSITVDTVLNQAYVTSNECTSIEINANVSTTWIGTVDLGGGTVTVKTGYTMTMGTNSEMILGASDDFEVEANATTTHTASDPNGLKITARNVTISGALSALSRGCSASGASGADGFGVNTATGVCAFQTGGYGRGGGGSGAGGGGGSHAGAGGAGVGGSAGGSTIYGNSLYPSSFGSGGGTGYYATAFGGAGGGIIHVTSTGVLTVNNRIIADGGAGSSPNSGLNGGGGGAGGSILIRAGTLAGSGMITANGGGGNAGGGGGGGGRVAVSYGSLTTFSLANIVSARGAGGAGGAWGTGANGVAGTAYMLDRVVDDGAGTITITSGFDFNASGDYTRDTISISSGAVLGCNQASALNVSSVAWLTLSNVTWSCSSAITSFFLGSTAGISTTNTAITFSAATSVTISAPAWTNVTTTISATQAGSRGSFDIGSNLVLRDFTYTGGSQGVVDALGGLLTFPNAYSLSLVSSTLATGVSSTLMTALTLDALSSINASEKGCRGSATTENGFGPNTSTGVCAITTSGYGLAGNGGGGGGGGAAHGGTGGAGNGGGAAQATTYGSSIAPTLPGSGGGGGYWQANGTGGSGGGRVYLVISGAATIDGSIRANGGDGVYVSFNGGGGGSGGSIYLQTGSLAGSGLFAANGGGGGSTGGGGGGGGRIALRYSAFSFSGTSSTSLGAGGTSAGSGSDGSVYTLLLNQAPDVPASLGQATLVNGSTTGTINPIFVFTLSDGDISDTLKYRIQIDDSADFSSPVVDYTSALAAQGVQSFQVGQAEGTGTYAVGSVSQALSDASYYWRVKAIDPAAAESSYTTANSGSVAFIVDSAVRTVSFAYNSMFSLESVTATSVRVVLDTTHFEDVTVVYTVADGTAVGSGEDYTLASGVATITAGETSTTIALVVVDDEIDEPGEDFTIILSDPIYATLGVTDMLTYDIVDNDTSGITSSESAFSLTEGGSSDSFTLALTSKPTSTVTITFTTSTAGITLTPMSLAFTGDNWSTPQTVTILATDDDRYESSHTTSVVMVVTGSVYAYPSVTPPTVTVTITDNETSDITVSASTLSITEGSSDVLTFVLTSQPTSTVTLVFSTPSEGVLSASSLVFTDTNWSTPQILTVSIPDNRDYVGTRTSSFSTTVSSDTTFANVVMPSVSITILEDDSPPGGGASSAGAFYVPFPFGYVPPASIADTSSQAPPSESESFEPQGPASSEALTQISSDTNTFRVTIMSQDQERLASFIDQGTSSATQALGSGERRALVRDALDTMGRAPTQTDLERLAQGEIPQTRNLTREGEQLARSRATFRTIYGRDPNFQNQEENLAWNTLMYRIRFPRDLAQERQGITAFQRLFRRVPTDPFQWAVVRVLGYVR